MKSDDKVYVKHIFAADDDYDKFHLIKDSANPSKIEAIRLTNDFIESDVKDKTVIVYDCDEFGTISNLQSAIRKYGKTEYETIPDDIHNGFNKLRYRYIRVSYDYFNTRGYFEWKNVPKYCSRMFVNLNGLIYGNTKNEWLDDFHNGSNGTIKHDYRADNERYMMRFDAVDNDANLMNFYNDAIACVGEQYFSEHTVDHVMPKKHNSLFLFSLVNSSEEVIVKCYASPVLEIVDKGKNCYSSPR